MRTAYFDSAASGSIRARTLPLLEAGVLRRVALGAIVAVAAVLRLANLSALGYVNHYYSAAVEAMLQSWHNFFFVAAEPGGSVSVDKPPVGLWIEAVSARIFGINTFGLLLPEILAGLLSVIVVYHLVRRSFGTPAGLLAALALAIMPVVVATDRNNTIDSMLILALLLAAWAFIVATERGSFRHLLLGTALVGVGFNIKMLEAFLPLPAFYAVYLLGARTGLWRKVVNLAAASALLGVISLSWVTIVDLVPADQRPYVGSSGDNSEMSLAIGYNGVERLVGMGGRGGLLGSLLGGNQRGGFPGGGQPRGQGPGGNGQFPQRGQNGGGFQSPGPGANGGFGPQGVPGGFANAAAAGFSEIGQAGVLRLFTAPLSKEASWLLPFGVLGAVVLASRARPRWPIAPKHQALVLWGGWLLTGAVFFSIAGFFHEYYLSMIGVPLAALVGIGAMELWSARERRPWIAAGLMLAAVGATIVLQVMTARAFTAALWWLPCVYALAGVGAAMLVAAAARRSRRLAVAAFGCMLAAALVTPAIWSGLTALNPSANQSLPSAYSGVASSPPNGGGLQVNQQLLDYLEANTRGTEYLMAVPSSMQGSDYVLATGRPVLYLGGFMGQDRVVTADDLSRMVADGELRYIYWSTNGSGGGPGGFGAQQSDISSWVAANCTPVPGFDTTTRNTGAPGGTSAGGTATGGFAGGGSMQITLYQCTTGGSQ